MSHDRRAAERYANSAFGQEEWKNLPTGAVFLALLPFSDIYATSSKGGTK
jgi:hypothetical protein